jgi:hypothetical protein
MSELDKAKEAAEQAVADRYADQGYYGDIVELAIDAFLAKLRETHVIVEKEEYEDLLADSESYESACSAAQDLDTLT